jgi:hypothetical protein
MLVQSVQLQPRPLPETRNAFQSDMSRSHYIRRLACAAHIDRNLFLAQSPAARLAVGTMRLQSSHVYMGIHVRQLPVLSPSRLTSDNWQQQLRLFAGPSFSVPITVVIDSSWIINNWLPSMSICTSEKSFDVRRSCRRNVNAVYDRSNSQAT